MGAIRPPWAQLLRHGGGGRERGRPSAESSVLEESRAEPDIDHESTEHLTVPAIDGIMELAHQNIIEGTVVITGYTEGVHYTVDHEAGEITNLGMVPGEIVIVEYFYEEEQGGGGTPVALEYRGPYSDTAIYMRSDVVSYGGASWIVLVDNVSGIPPVEGAYYTLLSSAGPGGPEGPIGPEGDSAYEVAVANGFVGTEAEWLASLEGVDGFTMRVRYNGTLMPLRAAMNFRAGFALSDDNVNNWINIDGTGGSGGTGNASYTSLVKLGVA